jgi:hypothetical protein
VDHPQIRVELRRAQPGEPCAEFDVLDLRGVVALGVEGAGAQEGVAAPQPAQKPTLSRGAVEWM